MLLLSERPAAGSVLLPSPSSRFCIVTCMCENKRITAFPCLRFVSRLSRACLGKALNVECHPDVEKEKTGGVFTSISSSTAAATVDGDIIISFVCPCRNA
eukprot:COSAG06_NODE_475_length_15278_cov_5.364187_15_plen_100_part_00